MTTTLNVVFVILGFLGAWTALWVYGLSAKWWRNQIGRFLITQAGIISVVYFEGILRSVFHVKVPPIVGLVTNGVVAALMLYHAWVFIWLIRNNQSRERADQMDVRNTIVDQDIPQH